MNKGFFKDIQLIIATLIMGNSINDILSGTTLGILSGLTGILLVCLLIFVRNLK